MLFWMLLSLFPHDLCISRKLAVCNFESLYVAFINEAGCGFPLI